MGAPGAALAAPAPEVSAKCAALVLRNVDRVDENTLQRVPHST